MNFESIIKALGARRIGGEWMALCPCHEDRIPSLAIHETENGKILLYCFAGCGQEAVLFTLRSRGLWSPNRDHRRPMLRVISNSRPNRDEATRTKSALAIWQPLVPADGTIIDKYLNSRGLVLRAPATLRFHAGMKHPTGGVWPAMVALVTRGTDDVPLAIHRTFLARDGGGKAPVKPEKMMLGPCRGGAVRLSPAGNVLMVGEGIETCLSAMQAIGHGAWAALSTSGMRALQLPSDVQDVIVLADGDDPGEEAARACADRWKGEGRRVRIARPPKGMDFNSMLVNRGPSMEES